MIDHISIIRRLQSIEWHVPKRSIRNDDQFRSLCNLRLSRLEQYVVKLSRSYRVVDRLPKARDLLHDLIAGRVYSVNFDIQRWATRSYNEQKHLLIRNCILEQRRIVINQRPQLFDLQSCQLTAIDGQLRMRRVELFAEFFVSGACKSQASFELIVFRSVPGV